MSNNAKKHEKVAENGLNEEYDILEQLDPPKICMSCSSSMLMKDGEGYRCLECYNYFTYDEYLRTELKGGKK